MPETTSGGLESKVGSWKHNPGFPSESSELWELNSLAASWGSSLVGSCSQEPGLGFEFCYPNVGCKIKYFGCPVLFLCELLDTGP